MEVAGSLTMFGDQVSSLCGSFLKRGIRVQRVRSSFDRSMTSTQHVCVQTLSNRPSAPKGVFGSSERTEKTCEKAFLEKLLGRTSTGVFTDVKSSFGTQPASQNFNSPSPKVGVTWGLVHQRSSADSRHHAPQFGNRYATDTDMVKEARPGPGNYDIGVAAFGKQSLSQNSTMPEYRIGTGGRFGQYKSLFKGEYQTPAANDFR